MTDAHRMPIGQGLISEPLACLGRARGGAGGSDPSVRERDAWRDFSSRVSALVLKGMARSTLHLVQAMLFRASSTIAGALFFPPWTRQ